MYGWFFRERNCSAWLESLEWFKYRCTTASQRILSIKLSQEPAGQEKDLTVSESIEPWFLSHGTRKKHDKQNKEANLKLGWLPWHFTCHSWHHVYQNNRTYCLWYAPKCTQIAWFRGLRYIYKRHSHVWIIHLIHTHTYTYTRAHKMKVHYYFLCTAITLCLTSKIQKKKNSSPQPTLIPLRKLYHGVSEITQVS